MNPVSGLTNTTGVCSLGYWNISECVPSTVTGWLQLGYIVSKCCASQCVDFVYPLTCVRVSGYLVLKVIISDIPRGTLTTILQAPTKNIYKVTIL